MAYKILGIEPIYSGQIFSIERVEIRLPDKRARKYDRIQIQNAVTILPFDEDGNILFVRQFRVGSNSSLLELPAGKIEAEETAQATAEREIREETGMAARSILSLGKFFVSPGYSTEYMYSFLATGLYSDPLTPDADEFLNLEIIPLNEVLKMVQKGEIEDSKTLATLMLALPRLNII